MTITISVRSERWEETIRMPEDTEEKLRKMQSLWLDESTHNLCHELRFELEKKFTDLATAIWYEHDYRARMLEEERAEEAARRSRLRLVRG